MCGWIIVLEENGMERRYVKTSVCVSSWPVRERARDGTLNFSFGFIFKLYIYIHT